MSVHFNGEELKLVHMPHGHTDSDTRITFTESNVVHMGDQFFNGLYPNIDLGGGGDVRGTFTTSRKRSRPSTPMRRSFPDTGRWGT